jgi:hypothetical protein
MRDEGNQGNTMETKRWGTGRVKGALGIVAEYFPLTIYTVTCGPRT